MSGPAHSFDQDFPYLSAIEQECNVEFVNEQGVSMGPASTDLRYWLNRNRAGFMQFGVNGDRAYIDRDLLEHATPECPDLVTLTEHVLAGEELVYGIAKRYADERSCAVRVNKRAVGESGIRKHEHAAGYHENYFMKAYRGERQRDLDTVLITMNVARAALFGAGYTEYDGRYRVAGKLKHIRQVIGKDSTNNRSLRHIRDEPHADQQEYQRIHNICGDSAMSPWTIYVQAAVAHMAMREVVDGRDMNDLALHNPLQAAQDVTYDIHLNRLLPLDNGKRHTCIDILEAMCERFEWRHAHAPYPDDIAHGLTEFRKALDDCRREGRDALFGRSDWVTKLTILDKLDAKTRHSDSKLSRANRDVAYSDLSPNGLAKIMRERGVFPLKPPYEAIEQAQKMPPQTTRAAARGRAAQVMSELPSAVRRRATINWSFARVSGVHLSMPRPHEPYNVEVNSFIAALQDFLK